MIIYYQRKYCASCKKYYFYSTKTETDEDKRCPVDKTHETKDCVVVKTNEE